MKKKLIFVCLLLLAVGVLLFADDAAADTSENVGSSALMWKYIAAALSVGIACIAGGIAVGQIGVAAMGAMSENPEVSGKAMPFVGLAEGICLWGFLVALLILVLG
jgi:V/A-type H+-transporting ATPase subunit K